MEKTWKIPTDAPKRDNEDFVGTPDECPRCLTDTENDGLCDPCDDEVDL